MSGLGLVMVLAPIYCQVDVPGHSATTSYFYIPVDAHGGEAAPAVLLVDVVELHKGPLLGTPLTVRPGLLIG